MISNIAFKKDTPIEKFVEYVFNDSELKQKFLDGETIEFAYSKYIFLLSIELDKTRAKLQVYNFNDPEWSDEQFCNIDSNGIKTEEEIFVELAKTQPKMALAEVVDIILDIIKMDKNNADIELAIKLFVSYYNMVIISDNSRNISEVAKFVIDRMTENNLKCLNGMVSTMLKVINAINKDTLDDEGKTLYDLIDDELCKKIIDQQQT